MEFIDPLLQQYCDNHTETEPEHLQKLNRETQLKVLMPRMISGHFQGRVLSMFSKMIKPKYILEIGTYTGYSAISLAEGLIEGGKLITVDINDELEDLVRTALKDAQMEDKIELRYGNAMNMVSEIKHPWDIVFIDADKINYSAYYDMVFDSVRPGGYIIADNVLWSGKILNEKLDKDTNALMEFNKKLAQDSRVEGVLFPVRDGLFIVRKK